MNPIKIETLLIRNFKRVEIADVELSDAGLNIIGGGNAQGKSTFLDAIKYALGGGKYAPTNPHNERSEGATAIIRTRLSNGIEVERSGKSSSLKVVVDGGKGNQQTLNEFLNEFALDVGKFLRSSETEKTKALIEHLGIGEKLELIDQKVKRLFDERTLVNRDADRKRKLADAMPVYDNAPDERVDMAAAIAEERAASEVNRALDQGVVRMAGIKEEGVALGADIEEMRRRLERMEAKRKALKDEYLSIQDRVSRTAPIDTAPIMEKIKHAESLNKMWEANRSAQQADAEARAAAKAQQDLTDSIETARAQRKALLDSIAMPIAGLSVVDGALQYNGQRWDCMSGAERLKVSAAISRAFKPECGFLLIDELETMDWRTLAEFNDWAKAEGIQVIGAMVADAGKAGEQFILIEDGKVAK
jgi:DNA repair exonuclease SbcCD ATPase subunit